MRGQVRLDVLVFLTLLALGLFVLTARGEAATSLECKVVNVASTPTVVLPENLNRSALLLQGFAPCNMRCTDGNVQQPMVAGVDPDCPMGVGFIVSPTEPNVSVSGQPGYYGVIQFNGPGTPTGPIVCVHRVTGAQRALLVCEGQ